MRLQLLFNIVNNQLCPTQLHNYLTLRSECRGRTLREIHAKFICLSKVKSAISQSNFKFMGTKDWNKLPIELRVAGKKLGSFKRKTLRYLQEQDKTQHKCKL